MTITKSRDAEVRVLSTDELHSERSRLLAEVGMDYATLRSRGRDFKLNATQRGVLAEIEGIEFLLAHMKA